MTVEEMTLSAFLLARIEEDEQVFNDAVLSPGALDWHARRGLAECKVKRSIVGQHIGDALSDSDPGREDWHCVDDGNVMPCPTLRYLGTVYAGHPDYRAEWSPEAWRRTPAT